MPADTEHSWRNAGWWKQSGTAGKPTQHVPAIHKYKYTNTHKHKHKYKFLEKCMLEAIRHCGQTHPAISHPEGPRLRPRTPVLVGVVAVTGEIFPMFGNQ